MLLYTMWNFDLHKIYLHIACLLIEKESFLQLINIQRFVFVIFVLQSNTMSEKSTTYYFVNQAKCFNTENWETKYLSCWFSMNSHVHSTRYFNPKRISGLHKSLTTRLIQLSEINPSNFVRGASKIKTKFYLGIYLKGVGG